MLYLDVSHFTVATAYADRAIGNKSRNATVNKNSSANGNKSHNATVNKNHSTNGSSQDFSVWGTTTASPKCFELGMYARSDYEPPARPERYCTDEANVSEVFAKPTGFTLGWND